MGPLIASQPYSANITTACETLGSDIRSHSFPYSNTSVAGDTQYSVCILHLLYDGGEREYSLHILSKDTVKATVTARIKKKNVI